MYGDGNSTKLVRDVMNSTDQVIEGVKQTTGLDLASIIAGFVGGKAAGATNTDTE
jgi:flotillin